RADTADLGMGAHDPVARALADAADAHLARGAGHVLAGRVDAVAVGAADLVRGAVELTALAALDARALVAHIAGRADVALVRRPVAVVVEAIAGLGRRRGEPLTDDAIGRALGHPRPADPRLAGVARLAAPRAGDPGQEVDVVVVITVVVEIARVRAHRAVFEGDVIGVRRELRRVHHGRDPRALWVAAGAHRIPLRVGEVRLRADQREADEAAHVRRVTL